MNNDKWAAETTSSSSEFQILSTWTAKQCCLQLTLEYWAYVRKAFSEPKEISSSCRKTFFSRMSTHTRVSSDSSISGVTHRCRCSFTRYNENVSSWHCMPRCRTPSSTVIVEELWFWHRNAFFVRLHERSYYTCTIMRFHIYLTTGLLNNVFFVCWTVCNDQP